MSKKPDCDYEEIALDKGSSTIDLKNLARFSIEIFFRQKNWFVGGPIPEREMLSEDSIKTVLRSNFDETTFNFLHNKCLSMIPCPPDYVENGVPWSVAFLIALFKDMKVLGLPKDFQPGLALLYFKFCFGFDIPMPPIA